MEDILEIIKSIDSDHSHLNPTVIYNEGWMTRLLVNNSIRYSIKIKGLDFGRMEKWTSEALISSPFIRADFDREGYTHADIVLGDFSVSYETRGEIVILDNAKTFGIIEAKMGSNLSQGTKYALEYNQASRNLACIASQTYNSSCDIFFAVVGPRTILDKHRIDKQIHLQTMIKQIETRFSSYSDAFKKAQNMESIMTKARGCKIFLISYEEWIEKFENGGVKKLLTEFYEKSKKWNRIDI